MKILVYPDSQLGDIQALISGAQTGTVDMTYLSVGNAGVLKGGTPLNVAYVPTLFKSAAAAVGAVNSAMFQEMYETLATESGVRIFAAYGSRLPRAINTIKGPINKPADLKGMKIRVPPIELLRATFDKLGAKPVVMGVGDTYMALSRGQVDGQENGIDALVTYKWYEVTRYLSARQDADPVRPAGGLSGCGRPEGMPGSIDTPSVAGHHIQGCGRGGLRGADEQQGARRCATR